MFDHIVNDWINGEGDKSPKPTLQYTIDRIGDRHWQLNKGKGMGKALVIEDSEVRFELWFGDGISPQQRERAIQFFHDRLEMTI